MQQIHFEPGEHVSRAANRLVIYAKRHNTSAYGLFNEIRMETDGSQTAAEIVEKWQKDMDASIEAYKKSPEGIAAAERNAREVAEMQQVYDTQILSLSAIEWDSPKEILNWLRKLQPPSDRVGVNKHSIAQVIEQFQDHGFYSGMNCGDAFVNGNPDNELHWLIGQALDGLEKVAIHGMFLDFADKWEARFLN